MEIPKTSQEAHRIGRMATLEENVIFLLSHGVALSFDKIKSGGKVDCLLTGKINDRWCKGVPFCVTGDFEFQERELFEMGFRALRIQYEQDAH